MTVVSFGNKQSKCKEDGYFYRTAQVIVKREKGNGLQTLHLMNKKGRWVDWMGRTHEMPKK